MADDKSILERLRETLDEAEWSWLKPHAQRDALFIVRNELSLLEVGRAIAEDHSALVQGWIRSGAIARPTRDQTEKWDLTPSKRMMSLVVQPYVLAQEIVVH